MTFPTYPLSAELDPPVNPGTSRAGLELESLRQLASKADGYIDIVADMGADPSGVTDCSAAIQEALDVGGVIYRPSGIYSIETGLVAGSDTTFIGPGTIKVASGANVDLLTIGPGAQNVSVIGGVLDGNGTNQSVRVWIVKLTDGVTNFVMDHVEVKNSYEFAVTLISSDTTKNVRISDCYFHDNGGSAINARGIVGLTIEGNYFEAWSAAAAYHQEPCIGFSPGTGSDTLCHGVVISNNHFVNNDALEFAIESVGEHLLENATISGNTFDGNGLAGCGISGAFSRSAITGNTWRNGAGGTRSGIELIGEYVTVANNIVEDGIIAVLSHGFGATVSAHVSIVGNEITNGISNASGGGIGIQCGGSAGTVTDLTISDNAVELTNASPQSAIYLGTYGDEGQINRVLVSGNRLRCTTDAGNGIRLLAAASSSDILIQNNMVKGFANGYVDPANSNVTNVTVKDNILRGNTTPISHSSTGTGFQFKDNVTDIVTAVASAATVTLPPRNGDVYIISGTTNITSVTAGYAGQRVTLQFQGILTFTDGSNLKLAGDFVTSADDTISLICDGTNWFETARSAN